VVDQVLYGPAGAYRVQLRVYSGVGGNTDRLLAQTERGARREEAGAGPPAYFVAEAGALSATLVLQPEGIALQGLRLLAPGPVTLVATVRALPSAPDWFPAGAEYELFQGDAEAAQRSPLLFIPFRHRGGEEAPGSDRVAVERLVHALGYSIARANARLAGLPAPGGVGLAASLQVRVGVRAFRVGPGEQVVIALARSDEKPEQFLDLTLSTAADTGLDPEPGGR